MDPKRLTAVGLVAESLESASSIIEGSECAANTTPYAAATPMAGAPLTVMSSIALAVSS